MFGEVREWSDCFGRNCEISFNFLSLLRQLSIKLRVMNRLDLETGNPSRTVNIKMILNLS